VFFCLRIVFFHILAVVSNIHYLFLLFCLAKVPKLGSSFFKCMRIKTISKKAQFFGEKKLDFYSKKDVKKLDRSGSTKSRFFKLYIFLACYSYCMVADVEKFLLVIMIPFWTPLNLSQLRLFKVHFLIITLKFWAGGTLNFKLGF